MLGFFYFKLIPIPIPISKSIQFSFRIPFLI
jgi:hypothetical protein